MNIELGDEVKDEVTGFSGIAICETRWLSGCLRVTVQPRTTDKDGKVSQPETFDILQLKVVTKGAVRIGQVAKDPGGPRDDAAALRR